MNNSKLSLSGLLCEIYSTKPDPADVEKPRLVKTPECFRFDELPNLDLDHYAGILSEARIVHVADCKYCQRLILAERARRGPEGHPLVRKPVLIFPSGNIRHLAAVRELLADYFFEGDPYELKAVTIDEDGVLALTLNSENFPELLTANVVRVKVRRKQGGGDSLPLCEAMVVAGKVDAVFESEELLPEARGLTTCFCDREDLELEVLS